MTDKLISQNYFLVAVNFKRQIRRNLIQGNNSDFLFRAAAQKCQNIGGLSPEERQGLCCINDLREEHVFHIPEELLAHQFIDFADLSEIENIDFIRLQLLTDRLPYALHQALLFPDDPHDLLQFISRKKI